MNEPSLRRAGLTVILVAVFAKGFGYVREAVVAAVFGASRTVDLYLAAVTIPAIVGTIIMYAVPNALVPLLTHDGTTRRRARRAAIGLVGVMTILSLAGWLAAKPLSMVTAAGFSPAARSETVALIQLGTWAIALTTVEAIARSLLLARKQFVRSGVSYVWQSVAIIGAVIIWPERGALALMWGYVGGTALAAIWNLIPGFRRRLLSSTEPSTAEFVGKDASIGRWVAAVLLVDAVAQLFGLVDRRLGSYLPPGSIAALQYANQVAFLPFSIVGVGLSTAIFPYLSQAVGVSDRARAAAIIDRAVRWSLIGTVPVVMWTLLFRDDIVRVLYERGAFGEESRRLTGAALAAYALGLVPNVVAAIWGRLFYSARRWQPVLLASFVGLAVKCLCGIWWVTGAGVVGLAAATAAGYLAWLMALVRPIRAWTERGSLAAWTSLGLRVALLTGMPAAIVVLLGAMPGSVFTSSGHATAVVRMLLGAGGGLALLVALGPRLHIREAVVIRERIRGITLRNGS